jgi:hypothetical protein
MLVRLFMQYRCVWSAGESVKAVQMCAEWCQTCRDVMRVVVRLQMTNRCVWTVRTVQMCLECWRVSQGCTDVCRVVSDL